MDNNNVATKVEEYSKLRILEPLEHINKRVRRLKFVTFSSSFFKLIFSASIPVLVPLVPDNPHLLTLIAIISAMVSIVQGINTLTDYESKIAVLTKFKNDLEKEWVLFQTGTGTYSKEAEENFHLLVKNVENLYDSHVQGLLDSSN
ncbi:DUF4231 domain-containing protein [Enterococcus pseudoavium]|uniref:DUF4231 domain-containing protein n=1 Tax=Enterococcus pseudoavium TaxID=44007 RepID=A0AAE4I1Q1_9ENTE|nr:DUF4231 domain-containing protein [Enterococcus pseudoavium]MDT2737874.1 DUF4231 domain-containing protein [Enterococcus pseudoavium]MDT2753551.1 DUF4231 domain-containing protein [Enterococcus pseudoavium]